ncbi:MAG: hypothetical protein LBJ11_09140 [Oscillospiraceae bacterium]|nr:hypothetical protein [Oscillospiraceae bacterium]
MNGNTKKYRISKARQKQQAADIHVAAAVKVIAFDPAKMTVDVQPLSKHLVLSKWQSQPPILGVPIAAVRFGEFVLRPWYEKGDPGLIVYLDHDIDKVTQDGQESEPNTERNHSDSDAYFIGGNVLGQKDIAAFGQGGVPDQALALGTADGKQWVAVKKDGIQSQADKWQHRGDIEITGDVSITGDVDVTGKITATGEIHSDTDVTAVGISLKNHTHQVNLGNSGGPVTGPTNPPT